MRIIWTHHITGYVRRIECADEKELWERTKTIWGWQTFWVFADEVGEAAVKAIGL